MTAYTLTLFILCVLLATHPGVHQWIRERVEDVREAMEDDDE